MLRVNFAGGQKCNVGELEDSYSRGGDLVATYAQTPFRQFRTQVYWRSESHSLMDALAAVELVMSVQTSLLDSRPEVTTGSRLPTTEIFHLRDAEPAQFDPLVLAPNSAAQFDRTQPSCFLCRLDGQVSYAEMVHPLDAHKSSILLTKPDDGRRMLELEHQLFTQQLEKGVILRSRVLGILLPQEGDLAAAARHYLAFAAAEPPLTT